MKTKAVQTWAGDGVIPPDEKRRLKAIADQEKEKRRLERERQKKIKAQQKKNKAERKRLLEQEAERKRLDQEYKAQKKAQGEALAKREKRKIEIGCARFDYTSKPYKDGFIVEVTGVSDVKHLSEYKIFLEEMTAEISFRTPGEDDPLNPWRLPILRKFTKPKFKVCVGGRPWVTDDDPDEPSDEEVEVPEEALIHPHYFRVGFYCDAIE